MHLAAYAILLTMRINRGGYTIIEVSIVLAISGLLLVSAMALFRNKQSQTQFSQTMQDLDSKIQSIANQVKGGSFPDSSAYTCTASGGGRPQVSLASGSTGTNTPCITLGRALQANATIDTLYIFTVLGLRNVYSGSTDTGVPASSVKTASPEPIMDPAGVDLTESYKLLGGATVYYSKVSGLTNDIVGFYLSPQSDTSAGQGSTFVQGYPIDTPTQSYKAATASATLIKECIEQLSSAPATCVTTTELGQWDLCVQSSSGSEKALLTVNSTSGGITTKITYNGCV